MTETNEEFQRFFGEIEGNRSKSINKKEITLEEKNDLIEKDKDRLVEKIENFLGEIRTSKVAGNREEEKEEWHQIDSLLNQLKILWDIQLEIQCDIAREYYKKKKTTEIVKEINKSAYWDIPYIQ